MTARPTDLPQWATSGSAEVVEPPSGKKVLGWEVAEKPPAPYENWRANNVFDWVAHIAEGEINIPAISGMLSDVAGTNDGYKNISATNNFIGSSTIGSGAWSIPLLLPRGMVVNDVLVYGHEANGAGETYTAQIHSQDPATGTITQISTTKTSGFTGADAVMGWSAADAGVPFTVGAITAYYVNIVFAVTTSAGEAHVFSIGINDQ